VNGTQCELDAPRVANLGANVIRVYSVDPTLNHDACMSAFEKAGIYIILDMATPLLSINRANPEWTKDLRNAFAQVVDGFQKYDNLLGFFAGNEIVNDADSTQAAAYAKAVIADMKAYRDLMQYRSIPIGYSAADIEDLRTQQQDYFNCGNESTSADFFGANRYTWCGKSSMTLSGYDTLYEQIDGYSIPYFFSENGCRNKSNNRDFDDQVAVLGRQMNDRLSGNIIYEWAEGETQYGLVSYANPDDGTGTMKTLQDFSNLKSQWATLEPAGVKVSDYDPTLTKRDCPAYTSGVWNLGANDVLPTVGMDGFTAPTRPRSTSTAAQTGTRTGVIGAATSGTNNQILANVDSQGKKGISTGAIAGIVLGVLVLLVIILGVILLLLRKKKKQRAAKDILLGERQGGESDKILVGSEETGDNPHDFYGPRYTELSGNGAVQELDPAKGNIATMRANEIAGDNRQVGELHNGQHSVRSSYREPSFSPAAVPAPTSALAPSPYVEAQRKVEMSWLESEEAKLRQRREQLMIQSGEREA
jgi:hypothetical protein